MEHYAGIDPAWAGRHIRIPVAKGGTLPVRVSGRGLELQFSLSDVDRGAMHLVDEVIADAGQCCSQD
jgi:hypothetical protein